MSPRRDLAKRRTSPLSPELRQKIIQEAIATPPTSAQEPIFRERMGVDKDSQLDDEIIRH